MLIVIASFDYSENIYNTEAHDEIKRAIEAARDELDFANLRVQVEPTRLVADDRAGAENLGDRYDASIVIWGADTGVRVTVNFYNRKQPDLPAADVQLTETDRTQIANPSAYAEFITQDLPDQLAFLSLFAIGQSYGVEQAYTESAEVIEKAVGLLGEEPAVAGAAEAYFVLGWLYSVPLPDLERAVTNYTRALELDPQYAAAYNNRGSAHADLQDYVRAIGDYDQALALDPQFASAYYGRGLAYANLLDYAQAIQDYDQALALDPQFASAYYGRGLAYANLLDYAQAIQDYDQALALNLEYADAYYSRGLTHKLLGQPDLARADFERFLELSDDPYWREQAEATLRELDAVEP